MAKDGLPVTLPTRGDLPLSLPGTMTLGSKGARKLGASLPLAATRVNGGYLVLPSQARSSLRSGVETCQGLHRSPALRWLRSASGAGAPRHPAPGKNRGSGPAQSMSCAMHYRAPLGRLTCDPWNKMKVF